MSTDTAIYNDDAGFALWSGFRRIHGNILRLAFTDMAAAPGLNISGQVFHYRWGTLQSHANSPDNGRNAVPATTGTRVMTFTADGLKPGSGGTGLAYVDLPGATGEYQFLYEPTASPAPMPPAPPGVVDSFILAGWTDTGPGDFRVLFGGHWQTYNADPTHASAAVAYLSAADHDDTHMALSCSLHTRDYPTNEATFHTSLLLDRDAALRHILVHQFIVREPLATWWYARWFVNGCFKQETKAQINDGQFRWYANSKLDAVQASMLTSYKPALFAMKRSKDPWTGLLPWGTTDLAAPFTDTLDEVMLAKCHPVLQDGLPVVEHTWSVDEQVFEATRHPSVTSLGVTAAEFVTYGPVIDTDIGSGAAIYQVRVDFTKPSPSTGQSVAVSVRASNTSFLPTNAVIPWSDWRIIDDPEIGTNVAMSGGGHGNYVQMRLRLLPSSDCTMSPAVSRIQWWAQWDDNIEDQQDLGCTVTVLPYQDLASTVTVIMPDSLDLPCEAGVIYVAPPLDLPAEVFVQRPDYQDLACDVTQSLYSQDLPNEVLVYENQGYYQDIEGDVTVISYYLDLPAETYVTHGLDLPCSTSVTIYFVPMEVVVQQPGHQDLPSEVVVAGELPGDVEPITSSVAEKTWTTSPLITFNWDVAAWTTSPILAYYWKLTQTKGLQPSQSWSDQTTTSVEVDMSQPPYGGGVWYFKVAARNAAGFFGPAASYEVWFNNPPSAPASGFLRAEGYDTLFAVPLVRSRPGPTLSWSPSEDANSEPLTYEVQVASRPDFGTNPDGSNSVFVFKKLINTTSWVLSPVPNPGIWFCRVRAFDGKQSSNWSAVGSFRLNAPPGRPTSLAVAEL